MKTPAHTLRMTHRQFAGLRDRFIQVIRIPSHGATSDQHGHEFCELVLVVGGRGTHWVGDETYRIETGDVFILLGDITHGYLDPQELSIINVLFIPDRIQMPLSDLRRVPGYHALFELEPQQQRLGHFTNRLRLTTDQLTHARQLVAELEEELDERPDGYRFMATTHLMRLIGYLSRCYSHGELDDVRPLSRISVLLGYMERHYAEPLKLADFCRVTHMSQTTLMRHFRRFMGEAPVEYLIRLRVNKARELLRGTDLPVGDIALEVGFCDSSYLCRQFQRVTGMSPRRYRTVSSDT